MAREIGGHSRVGFGATRRGGVVCLLATLVMAASAACVPDPNAPSPGPSPAGAVSDVVDADVLAAAATGPVDVIVSFDPAAGMAAGAAAVTTTSNADQAVPYVDASSSIFDSFKAAMLASTGVGASNVLDRYNKLPSVFVRIPNAGQLAAVAAYHRLQSTPSGSVDTAVTSISFPKDAVMEGMTEARNLTGLNTLLAPSTGDPRAGAGTSIAVIDSGYDGPAVATLFGVTPDVEPVALSYSPADNCHGSVVSYIASQTAPGAHIVSYDISSGANCLSPTFDAVKGEQYILSALNDVVTRRRLGEPLVSVNLSLRLGTGSCSSLKSTDRFTAVFEQLRQLAITPVVSSGNGGQLTEYYPACASRGVVRVGAVWDQTTTLNLAIGICGSTQLPIVRDQISCFSNRLSDDILAPGGPYAATGLEWFGSLFTGTSYSAPMVAGAVAILKQRHPTLTSEQVVQSLRDSGANVVDPSSGRTFKRLDIAAADALASATATNTTLGIEAASGGAFVPNATGSWTVSGDGRVIPSPAGGARFFGDGRAAPTGSYVGLAPTNDAGGYWVVDTAGRITPYGNAPAVDDAFTAADGSAAPAPHTSSVSDFAVIPASQSLTGAPAVVMVTRTGELLPSNLPFGLLTSPRNEAGATDLSLAPIDGDVSSIEVTPDGRGYWMTTTGGTVAAFGSATPLAPYVGTVSAPVVDMKVAPDGSGYYLLTEDGDVRYMGSSASARSLGSPKGRFAYAAPGRENSTQERAIGLSLAPDLRSYRVLTCTGRVFGVARDQSGTTQTSSTPATRARCQAPQPLRWPDHPAPPAPATGFAPGQPNGASGDASISSDGRWVAFTSTASNLTAGDTDGVADVFVWNLQTATVARQPLGVGGAQPNGPSGRPSISADGSFVTFTSTATNLVAGDTNGVADVFRWDRTTGAVDRIRPATTEPNGPSGASAVSSTGRYVAFTSLAANLVGGDDNGAQDVFRWDASTGDIARLQSTPEPDGASGGEELLGSTSPSISDDGRFIAFESRATNLVTGDTNSEPDVFRWDAAGPMRRAVGQTGQQLAGSSLRPTISSDGTWVAFDSDAANFTGLPATATHRKIVVWGIGACPTCANPDNLFVTDDASPDRTGAQIGDAGFGVTFTAGGLGTLGYGTGLQVGTGVPLQAQWGTQPSASTDGRVIAFTAQAVGSRGSPTTVLGGPVGPNQLFVWDRATGSFATPGVAL